MRRVFGLLAGVIVFLACGTAAKASLITQPDLSIFSAYTAYPSYEATYAIDGNTATDYASDGGGADTFITFSFNQPYYFNQIDVTDRTSSGGANGSLVTGLYDFTTAYDLIFSMDSSFTSTTVVHVTRPMPGGPQSGPNPLSDFETSTSIANIQAQYVEYQVTETAGVNPGMAEIDFYGTTSAVPEPTSFLLVGGGLLVAGIVRQRRTARP